MLGVQVRPKHRGVPMQGQATCTQSQAERAMRFLQIPLPAAGYSSQKALPLLLEDVAGKPFQSK